MEEVEAAAAIDQGGGGGKRKRGRPPRGHVAVVKKAVEEEEGEDVCFLCFDGGSLVLCDRRGCPKAYHPACVKRDEAFFQSKAKWNCGWHLCSICQKAAHHMCYTCTYSLCKACTKDVDYLSVRGNKGFCAACMQTVMLIEDIAPGNKEKVQVDFDDKSSWEYLFKMYWIFLKGKLSLTLEELIQAKKPCKEVVPSIRKEQHLDVFNSNSDCKSSISAIPSQHLEVSDLKKRRKKEQLLLPTIVDCPTADKSSNKSSTLSGSTEWATKELLEFVGHMRNGDVSMLFNFDVQGLLLEYIKRNNLRDPRRKSQIICDARLMSLFLKPRVGHFEMLKLLEYHFLIKEDNQKEDILGNTVRTPNQVEGGGNNESLLKTDKNKKRKNRKNGEERGQQINLDEFAAIDVHNIKLIYLRRSLMENLVTASGNFHDKVLGSIVRIRISTGDLKKDMYRLVQVVGTFKASVPYKVGGKTVDVMLKILNLNKKELVAIDAISNQEFSEDECRRFRQSIKCGFLKRMTVGQVQEKARALLEVRLNDWLETEISRLNHLRDRASENGRKKELRECVEKIELLKTPEERQRRLHKNPIVHADRKMDPKCESDDDAGDISKQKQADPVKQIRSGIRKPGRDPFSTHNKIKQAKINVDKGPSSRLGDKVTEMHRRKEAGVLKAPTKALSNGSPPSAYNSETEKLWHYRDPNGKIQGPFCLVQLRKWSTSGYFPPDMMVWSINTDEVESLHLADVLSGNFHKALPSRSSTSLPYQDRFYICEDRHSSTVNPTIVNDGKLSNGSWNCSSATSVHQMTVHEDRKWTSGPTNGNISSPGNTLLPNIGPEYQPDSRRFSGQSCVESWKPSTVNTVSNNSDSNFALGSVTKSSDSPDLKINAINLPSPIPVSTDTRDLENHANKDQKPSQPFTLVQELAMEELPSPTPKPSERDEKASLGIQNNLNHLPMMIDMDEKVDSSIGNSPNSLLNAKDRVDKVQATESKTPVTNLTSNVSKSTPNSGNEKTGLLVQNPHSPSPKTIDDDHKVNLSIQNVPSPLPNPNDGNDQILTSKSNPQVTSLIPDFSTPKPSETEEKAGMSIQNLPSVDDHVKIDLAVQNMPSSSLDPSLHGNILVQTNESKPPGTNLAFTSSAANLEERDEKGGTSILSLSSPSPKMVNQDGKVDSTTQNLPITREEKEGNDNVQANESKPPSTNLTFISSTSKLKDSDEKASTSILNLSSPSPKMIDKDEKVDMSTQNLPSFQQHEGDENEKVQANDINPSGTVLTCTSSSPMPTERDEKAGMSIQIIPSPSSETVNEDGEIDSTVQNFPSSTDGNEKVVANEDKPPGTSSFCPPDPSCRDEKAVICIRNPPSASPKTVDENDVAASTDQKFSSSQLDLENGNEKVQSSESTPPGSSVICISSTAEASKEYEKAKVGIQNLPSPSLKMVDGDEKVDSTSCAPNISNKNEKLEVSDVCSDEAFTPASNCDQFAPPSTQNHLCSPSNQRALSYELIEFTTLGDESVSDLLAEVDAMEAQGDVASPIPVMYSDDDFFEDSKGDYFASIRGMGHPFDFGKNVDASEQRCPTEYDIFDPGKRSDGEASTSNELRLVTLFNHNSGSQAESDPNNQINPSNMEHSSNSGSGGLTQGMAYMGWGSDPGLAQVNTDMNENTLFRFMGHERQR